MYNRFLTQISQSRYQRTLGDSRCFGMNRVDHSRPVDLIRQSTCNSSRFYRNAQKIGQLSDARNRLQSPFLNTTPIRYVQKTYFKNNNIGLTRWEKQRYLQKFTTNNEQNEQINSQYQFLKNRENKNITEPNESLKIQKGIQQKQKILNSTTNGIDLKKKFMQMEEDYRYVSLINDQEHTIQNSVKFENAKKTSKNNNGVFPFTNSSFNQSQMNFIPIKSKNNHYSFADSIQDEEKNGVNSVNIEKKYPKTIQYKSQKYQILKIY